MPNTEYKVVTDPCEHGHSETKTERRLSTTSGLAIKVNEAIKDGWEPIGPPVAARVLVYYDLSRSYDEDSGSLENEWSQALIRRR